MLPFLFQLVSSAILLNRHAYFCTMQSRVHLNEVIDYFVFSDFVAVPHRYTSGVIQLLHMQLLLASLCVDTHYVLQALRS